MILDVVSDTMIEELQISHVNNFGAFSQAFMRFWLTSGLPQSKFVVANPKKNLLMDTYVILWLHTH